MKKITYLFILLLSITVVAQNSNGAIDAAGDIMMVAYDNADDDGIAFLLLDHAPDGTEIRFSDEEWEGSSFNSPTNEGDLLWTNNTGSTIVAGTVIIIDNADGDGISASQGSVSESDAGFTTSNGDQVIAFTGTRSAPGTFLTFHGDENSVTTTPPEDATLTGTGLTAGVNALTVPDAVGYYSGITEFNGSITEVSAAIANSANWTITSFSPAFPANVPTFTGTAFGDVLSNSFISYATASVFIKNRQFVLSDTTLNLQVFNALGQEVANQLLPKGIYILRITNQKGEQAVLKKAM